MVTLAVAGRETAWELWDVARALEKGEELQVFWKAQDILHLKDVP
ncbi:hypothetical protein [Nitritalea halalkaliphila]|nr:hypothetical protein [Nitritalea halalkaliphila]